MTVLRAAAVVNSGSTRAKASSALLVLALVAATPLHGQRTGTDSSRATADSLAIRLRRAEDAIAILQQQLGEQSAQAVTTRSRMKLEFNGRVLVHAIHNDRDVNNADDPQFVAPTSLTGDSRFVMTARQTTLGAVLTANDVLGGQFTGDVDVDFYGGQLSGSGGRTFPLIRLRTARGAVRWPNGELMVGQESPLIAGLNPVSPSAIGTPLFVTAGNLWLWLPQVRGTIESNGAVRLALQAAVVGNITGNAVGQFDTGVDAAEMTGRPAGEARLRARWGEAEMRGEIGCGGHLGWAYGASANGPQSTYATACDARIPFTSSFEVRAEAYTGRGLRGLGGGGIGQNLARDLTPLVDHGWWAQLNIDANSMVKLGGGCGGDQPREADVSTGGRLKNQSCAGYGILRPSGPLFFGLEVREIHTKYAVGSFNNYHVSLASGFEF